MGARRLDCKAEEVHVQTAHAFVQTVRTKRRQGGHNIDMATAEKFCLRWNDFESNISVAFRELRDEKDFFDVTLACEDNQVSAHKVILSACSPFFRKVLRRNPHQHPLLYLKGVKYQELLSVLNFMYMGEVNVAQEELNSFLAVAEELRVKGLTQNSESSKQQQQQQQREPPQRSEVPPPKRMRPAAQAPAAPSRQNVYGKPPDVARDEAPEDEVQEVEVPVKAEPREQVPAYHQETQESAVALEDGYQVEEQYEEYGQYEEGCDGIDPNTGMPMADGNKGGPGRVMMGERNETCDMLVRSRMVKNGGEWQCTDCGKTAALNSLYAHVETHHVNVSFECFICMKECKTRNSLLLHRSRYHKGF